MNYKTDFALIATVCLLAAAAPSRADELADKGRDIFTKNQRAIVTVEVVQKTSYSSPGRSSSPNEAKQDLTGTVVDPSGLTVLALSACDPAEMYQRMMADDSRFKMETEVTDIKILLEDGTEMPAEIVLRDKDLDLAFIRPKTKPASPMPAIDLGKTSPAQVLDQVITLNRLNRAAGRAYSASVERISAVIQKPRTFYIPDSTMTTTTLGSPAFSLNGNVLGVVVMRAVGSKGSGNMRDGVTSIILPAEDISKAAKQAPEAKGEDEKKEPVKETKEGKPDAAK
ncbi:MAG TPA: serine protease [Verrucomicrobiae bacterium]|nr:serine protease [Verrucomicrobiae bacterium]